MNRVCAAAAFLLSLSAFACGSTDTKSEGGRFDDVGDDAPAADADPSAPASPETPAATPDDPAADPGTAPAPDPTTPVADATNTCQTARDLGSMIGDDGEGQVSAQGKCNEWLRIRVTETDTWAWANDIKLSATLVSPKGSEFDVAMYLNEATDVLECATATAKSGQSATQSKIVKLAWGEKYAANGGDDSRTVSIEIKAKDGKCAAEPWTLLLQGNQ